MQLVGINMIFNHFLAWCNEEYLKKVCESSQLSKCESVRNKKTVSIGVMPC